MYRYFVSCFFFLFVTAPLVAQNYNYEEVLQKSVFFYEAQQSGKLPDWNRVEWRGDSTLNDEVKGGWFDAGDHVKFGFPMASSVTLLSWGVIEFAEGFKKSGQLPHILRNIRFATDYFLAAFLNDTPGNYQFVGQIGNGSQDHAFWGPPEVLDAVMKRPTYKITTSCPGSDLAGETAAALAASSIVFRKYGNDIAYANRLLDQAKKLYDFADKHRGKYSDCITDAAAFYNSWSGYQDELVWGAVWLDKASLEKESNYNRSYNEKALAEYAKGGYDNMPADWTIAWDDKKYGFYVLLNKTDRIENWFNFVTSPAKMTPGGLSWIDTWGSLRYAANSALLSFIASKYEQNASKKQSYIAFAKKQIDYMLGDNPNKRSYVVGFGNNPPKNPHHRAAHGSWKNSIMDPVDSRNVLYGALVGGPNRTDSYTDNRNDYQMNEVATDYNAGFTGALSAMIENFGSKGNALANFPMPIVKDNQLTVTAGVNASGRDFVEVKIILENRSAMPAFTLNDAKLRYYFTADGANSFEVRANYNQCKSVSEPISAGGNNYYVVIDCSGTPIFPGGQSESKKEIQLRIKANSGDWVNTNDWSYNGISQTPGAPGNLTERIPVFIGNNSNPTFGVVPGGSATPIPTPTVMMTPTMMPTLVVLPTNTVIPSPTRTVVATPTRANTPTFTATPRSTITVMPTSTPMSSPTVKVSPTPVKTPNATNTPLATKTSTPKVTPTVGDEDSIDFDCDLEFEVKRVLRSRTTRAARVLSRINMYNFPKQDRSSGFSLGFIFPKAEKIIRSGFGSVIRAMKQGDAAQVIEYSGQSRLAQDFGDEISLPIIPSSSILAEQKVGSLSSDVKIKYGLNKNSSEAEMKECVVDFIITAPIRRALARINRQND
jgi:endoglucanase